MAIDYATLVNCISVIDESESSSPQSVFNADWASFRSNYPYRTFWLLQPGRVGWTLMVPPAYTTDPYANGPIQVNRDGGSIASRSDWFAICQLDQLPEGSVVSVAIDTSGSMTLDTVRASYDYFIQRCNEAGIIIIFDLTFPNELWIRPHNKNIPPSANFTADPLEIIQGESATLSWIVFGDVTSVTITDLGTIQQANYIGSAQVSPSETRTYFLEAVGPAGTSTRSVTINVLIPPQIFLTLSPETIIRGQCSTLSWYSIGDGDTIEWLAGGVSNTNLTSNTLVCPTTTTTYTAKISGPAGEETKSITLIVYQPPTVSMNIPTTLNYGDQGSLSYESSYCNVELKIEQFYKYNSSDPYIAGPVYDLPTATSAESGVTGSVVTGTLNLNISYDNFGPRFVQYVITATGNGGQAILSKTISIVIDETPDNIIIPESEDKFKLQDPVITPETEIVSEMLEVTGIDIPVEIKSNKPIQVDINGQQNWQNLREI